ncbi:nicotinate-nucleotide--dimethylbenzimidazole phosphoribosyltransferase [Corynebacterium aquilae]|uniref:Nicotinate-nucleotide--dimethylbenzimidazole phosphoribosyltransferase n=1 Tax=Corynebacterium aquilae DSM 44791 TaxID=1431546 RepID=A0A1L7CGZ0_9CORY|nr:nicotinate-nucleotide--dimethylbenzimidazole phosphoribosyltransferase [Corynebacterium aquilae]APT85130.1 nicotinate-nucleotide--dimethylbenzimidazole phosphoribosyltransferase [Corynebacterium aquilae DSM 44791]
MMQAELFPLVDAPQESVAAEARARQLILTKPAGSLGRLEELGVWMSACQGQCPPRAITSPKIVVFAGDHGVAQAGVSAFPTEVSIQMAANIAGGGAAINVLGRAAGASVRVADISLDHDTDAPEHLQRSCGNIAVEDAMTQEQVVAAIKMGMKIADEEVDSGADLLIAGDLGIGNTTPAAALIGALTNEEPVVVVGRGTGIDDEGWKRKVAAVRDAMFRVRTHTHDPIAVLRMIASPDLAAMAGFLAQAAVRRTPVILDGVVVTSAALVANKLAPGARRWWVAGHKGAEPAHSFALNKLKLEPVVEFEMRLGEGSGAAVALPIVKAATDILIDMATFESAGVSDKDA